MTKNDRNRIWLAYAQLREAMFQAMDYGAENSPSWRHLMPERALAGDDVWNATNLEWAWNVNLTVKDALDA